jgi:hypothetical protein
MCICVCVYMCLYNVCLKPNSNTVFLTYLHTHIQHLSFIHTLIYADEGAVRLQDMQYFSQVCVCVCMCMCVCVCVYV